MGEIQTCFRRIEKKYLLTYGQYEAMKKSMAPYVRPDAYSHYTLCNVYYDTPDYQLIQRSLEKPVYKEKLRVRSYGVPSWNQKVFVELKKKYEGVVYKRRVTLGAADAGKWLSGRASETSSQIGREIDWFLQSYPVVPRVFIGYDREAYAGLDNQELRITFDTDLRGRDWDVDLQSGDYGELILPPDQILMELKIPDKNSNMLNSIITGSEITLSAFFICTAVSLILGLLTGYLCMYKDKPTQSFVLTLAIMPTIVQIIIMLVNGNIGAGLAVAGTFGLVRFRSAPGSAREIGLIFLAMAIGLATGMGYVGLAAAVFLILAVFIFLLHAIRYGNRNSSVRELRITIGESLDYDGLFDDIFAAHTVSAELSRVCCFILRIVCNTQI